MSAVASKVPAAANLQQSQHNAHIYLQLLAHLQQAFCVLRSASVLKVPMWGFNKKQERAQIKLYTTTALFCKRIQYIFKAAGDANDYSTVVR
jgi:hypothetical protein